jgi:hypothetical protein
MRSACRGVCFYLRAGELLLEPTVLHGELADLCPKGDFVSKDSLDAVGGQVVPEVADAPELLADGLIRRGCALCVMVIRAVFACRFKPGHSSRRCRSSAAW